MSQSIKIFRLSSRESVPFLPEQLVFMKIKIPVKRHKDKIFVIVTNDLAGVFESASQGMGMAYYSKMLHKNPKFIKEVHEVIGRFTAECYKAYMDVGAEVFVESGDLAYHSGPMMSPKKFTELLLPAYRIITDTVHERGQKIVLHTDGHVTPLLILLLIVDLMVYKVLNQQQE